MGNRTSSTAFVVDTRKARRRKATEPQRFVLKANISRSALVAMATSIGYVPKETVIAPIQTLPTDSEAPRLPADLQSVLEATERRYVVEAMRQARGNKTQAGKLLGMKRTTLLTKIEKYKIEGGGHLPRPL